MYIQLLAEKETFCTLHIAGGAVGEMEKRLTKFRSGFHAAKDFQIKVFPESWSGGHHRRAHRFQIFPKRTQVCVVS